MGVRKLCLEAAKDAVRKVLKEQDALIEKAAKKWATVAIQKYPPAIVVSLHPEKPKKAKKVTKAKKAVKKAAKKAIKKSKKVAKKVAKKAAKKVSKKKVAKAAAKAKKAAGKVVPEKKH